MCLVCEDDNEKANDSDSFNDDSTEMKSKSGKVLNLPNYLAEKRQDCQQDVEIESRKSVFVWSRLELWTGSFDAC